MPRAILHFDADAFFASVEQAADPRLRGKPMAVGGLHRGIVASASYEARRYGIYTPMPMTNAPQPAKRLFMRSILVSILIVECRPPACQTSPRRVVLAAAGG